MAELSDAIFAADSIPAILRSPHDPFIVLTSNPFAILGLRAMYFLLSGVAERFDAEIWSGGHSGLYRH